MVKKRLIKLLSHSQKYIVYQIIWQWISLLCQILMVFSIAILVEQLIFGVVEKESIVQGIVIIGGGICLRFLCERKVVRASHLASVDVKLVLREQIYKKLLVLGAGYKSQCKTSQVVQMATEGVEQLEIYFGRYLSQLVYSLLAPLTLFAVLSQVSFKTSLVLLLCVPIIPISIVLVQKFAKKLLHKYWGIYTGLGDSFLENLQGLTTLKIYQADEAKAKEMDEEAQLFRKITMKVLTMQLNSISVMDIVAYGGAVVGMIVVINEFFQGAVSFREAFLIILLASEFFLPLRLLGSYFHIAMNGMAASDNIFALLDLEEPAEKDIEISLSTEGEGIEISLQSVSFSYEEERQILEHVSIDIHPQSFVALVGASGCGKSTIVGILMGRNKGYKGNILLNDYELSQIKEDSLMKHCTLVSHNSYIFKGSVRENLIMAKETATEWEMQEVLKRVNLWEFLESQSGLETILQEKGNNFSGGQCQRLALARALLHDSAVYIFDEATSNIDVESETLILSIIHELANTKTILFISHRLANVIQADQIHMMEHGKIVESGNHFVLMEKEGTYHKLYQKQQELENYTERDGGNEFK